MRISSQENLPLEIHEFSLFHEAYQVICMMLSCLVFRKRFQLIIKIAIPVDRILLQLILNKYFPYNLSSEGQKLFSSNII